MLAMSRVAVWLLFPLGILAAILSASRSARGEVWPGREWAAAASESQEFSGAALDQAADYSQRRGGASGCVIRHGYLVKEWASPTELADIKSATKGAFGATPLGLAVDAGLVGLDDKVRVYYGFYWGSNAKGLLRDVPRELYWAFGQGESILAVCPSLDIVAVRLGTGSTRSQLPPFTNEWDKKVESFFRLMARAVCEPFYIYSHYSDSAYQPADRFFVVARVAKDRIRDRSAYAFMKGMADRRHSKQVGPASKVKT
jgi:hypothetical protein